MKQIFIIFYLLNTLNLLGKSIESDSINPLVITGNVDIYARYGKNETFSSTLPKFRHGVGLGWVNLTFNKNWKKLDVKVDIAGGPRSPGLYSNTSDNEEFVYLKEAYISYKPTEKLRFFFGSITSHFGFEYNEPFENFTYSNSYTFTFMPASYGGLKAEYNLTDNWTLMAGIFGDSNVKIDKNKGKHLGSRLAYASEKLNFATDFIEGKEGDTTAILMVDTYGDYAFTDRLTIGAVVHGMTNKPQNDAKMRWFGLGLYAKYQLSTPFSLGFRGEYLDDGDGYYFAEIDNKIWSWTLAGHYQIGNFKIEPEIRFDTSNKFIFNSKNKGLVKNELSFLMAGLYQF